MATASPRGEKEENLKEKGKKMASNPRSKISKVPTPKKIPAIKQHPSMPDGSGKRPARAISQPSDPADSRWYGGTGKSKPA
jgi:hypothetical protein